MRENLRVFADLYGVERPDERPARRVAFIEEIDSRNLGILFVVPLSLAGFVLGQVALSVLRTLIGVGGACFFA